MNNLFLTLKKLSAHISYPLIFLSSFLILINVLSLFSVDSFEAVSEYFYDGINALFFAAACGFIVFYTGSGAQKAIACAVAAIACDLTLYSVCALHVSLILSLVIALVFSAVMKNVDLVYGYLSCLLIGVVAALLIGISYDYLFDALRSFSSALKGKGALFGMLNNLFSLAFSGDFTKLFYHKEYSSASIVNGSVVSGAVDIFKADTENPKRVVSKYLTGKYFVNIFISLGLFLALYSRIQKNEKTALVLLLLLAVIFGDVRLLSLFVLAFNPVLYLCLLVLIFISYLSASMLDIRIGFLGDGSLIELFKFGNNILYFLLCGAVICILTYFAANIVLSKYNLRDGAVLPREVRKLVTALGGERNIERIQNGKLYVVNPNLIDILRVNCDIHENLITLENDDLELLEEYFYEFKRRAV